MYLISFLLFTSKFCSGDANGGTIPVAYSDTLDVKDTDLESKQIKPVEIKIEEFEWPSRSYAVYRCAIGNFNLIFGLNATGENVAYFITGAPPSRRVYAYNWLRIAPYLPDLYPIVKGIKKERPLFKRQVFITDESLECRMLRELISSDFTWNVLGKNDPDYMMMELNYLRESIVDINTHFAICDQGDYYSSTTKTYFAVMVLQKVG
ncbi:unnamed protein product [Hymenolepis diminuta]|uniref:Egg protein n=1 Tax=Hymenolepis diminuta TaxID=6216 RepID=A0A0R3SNJ6_HYMDI|nr:unnamed protein product [Hymenolepis diminuta]